MLLEIENEVFLSRHLFSYSALHHRVWRDAQLLWNLEYCCPDHVLYPHMCFQKGPRPSIYGAHLGKRVSKLHLFWFDQTLTPFQCCERI